METRLNINAIEDGSIPLSKLAEIPSVSGASKEIVDIIGGTIEVLEPNKIYIVSPLEEDVEIQSISEPLDDLYAEYTVIVDFDSYLGAGESSPAPSLILPTEVKWANGSIPDLQGYTSFELSIVYFATAINSGYHAVLTPFKYIE